MAIGGTPGRSARAAGAVYCGHPPEQAPLPTEDPAIAMKTGALRASRSPRARPVEFLYPESDGRPMGETDDHRSIMIYLIEALKLWFSAHRNVYVSGNLMMYYVEGDANVSVSPDVFVVKGVPAGHRRVYKVWEEKAPCVVIEVSSRSTKAEDLTHKFELYRDVLEVAEYYIYDPLREYVPTRLRAWVRRNGRFVERHVLDGRIRSRELGLDLVDVDGMLRLVDRGTGRTLPALQEAETARVEAETELRRVTQENRRLRDELEELRRKRTP